MDCEDDVDTNHIRVLPDTCVELFVNYTSTSVAIIGNELHKRSIVKAKKGSFEWFTLLLVIVGANTNYL
jgi:hypothetical protein